MGVDEAEMTPERTDAIRDLLLQNLREEPGRRALRRRRRLLAWGGGLILVFGGAATAGTVVNHADSVSNKAIVHCYSSTIPDLDGTYPGSSATVATSSGVGQAEDALGICREMWAQGTLAADFDAITATNVPQAVPELQVCVMGDGSAAVVPGRSTGICQAVGLAPLAD